MVTHYNTWTGRYFSNLMMAVNPFSVTSNPATYPLMMLGLFVIFAIALLFFIGTVLKLLGSKLYKSPALPIVFVLYLALFFHKMPRTTDSFYWFAGASSHLLALSLALVAVGTYFAFLFNKQASLFTTFSISVLLSVVGIIISGSNETLAVQWLFSLVFMIVYCRLILNIWEKCLILPFVFACIGFAILYFAPGNAIRASELKGGHDILLLLVKPWGLVLETTVRYLSFALLLLVFWSYPLFKKINQSLPIFLKSSTSLKLLTAFGLGLFLLTFVPSVWTMGGLPPRRVLNNTYMLFLLYGSFLLLVANHRLSFLERWASRLDQRVSVKVQKMVFAVTLVFVFNNFYAWKDLVHLPQFTASLEKRDLLVTAGKGSNLILEPLSYFPTTFFYEDITTKIDDYRNIVFSEFYGLKTVLLSKDYDQGSY